MKRDKLTAEEIADKYVHGKHGALTDNQEKLDMAADIRKYAEQHDKFFLNHVLNEAFSGKNRIKGIPSSNKIAEFVNEYLKNN